MQYAVIAELMRREQMRREWTAVNYWLLTDSQREREREK